MRNAEVQDAIDSFVLCGRSESPFRFIHVTELEHNRMRRRTAGAAVLAAGLLGLAVSGNCVAQSVSDKAATDLTTRVLQLTAGNSSPGPLAVTQATEVTPQATPQKQPDIHYVPTPQELVAVMLDMAKVGKDDVVYDLGSGDGRLIVTAAQKYGATGVGIDIDPQRIAESKENAKKSKVEDRVRFLEQDLFGSDFHDATVVTLYLLSELNVRLRPQLFAQLKPGTRVVSHAFMMGDWQPDEHKSIEVNGQSYDAYFWVVPANMSGRWKVTGDGSKDLPRSVNVDQKFQKISVYSGDTGQLLGEGKVNGTTFTLEKMNKGANAGPRLFQGKIDGDTIQATTPGSEEHRWKATREEGSKAALDASAVN
jgi:Methyltransferase domain